MNIKMDLQQVFNIVGVSNLQELIEKSAEDAYKAEAAKILKTCQDNCQAAGGQSFTDIVDLILEGVAVSVFVDPLDLMLVFEKEEQYKRYAELERGMRYDQRRLMGPMCQIVYYKDTGTCVYISSYEPYSLAAHIVKEVGCESSIRKYDADRFALQLDSKFEEFIDSMRALDFLARSPARGAVYRMRRERNTRLIAYNLWKRHQKEMKEKESEEEVTLNK